jgi:ribose-phosphate pyrophosphokinase
MLDQMANDIKLLSGSGHPELSSLMAARYVEQS